MIKGVAMKEGREREIKWGEEDEVWMLWCRGRRSNRTHKREEEGEEASAVTCVAYVCLSEMGRWDDGWTRIGWKTNKERRESGIGPWKIKERTPNMETKKKERSQWVTCHARVRLSEWGRRKRTRLGKEQGKARPRLMPTWVRRRKPDGGEWSCSKRVREKRGGRAGRTWAEWSVGL